ncbi:hemerythrin family protein [Sulfurimonas sp.]|jgi:hemerythrin|uniref:bacteriohemerythrin n=1 Tax=Sulfurimonas sp. TaxID=2022749 RepID=UPI0025DF27E3|nr:hemerythrin family protein [Sulfurimonas sp.]MBT5933773.1 hemerythrin family protein [Sulfurimonas sp.]
MITLEQIPMVAIASMNDTHMEESLIVNKLTGAATNKELDLVAQMLRELLAHTQIHFDNEEEIMTKSEFPDMQKHKTEHDRHLKELAHLIKYFDGNREPNAILAYIHGNLVAWSLHHVETLDAEAAEYFSKKQ